ncbi:hypothetical protein LJR289_000149 [Pseudoduganella sp. LjRoot289]|uniref:hypothetical protein n=1 Tax=Pseudoduganella sp. LjRoot289 TaxID=3342314 RepID=UPI003ECE017C
MSSRKKLASRHLALHATLLGVARWRLDTDGTAPSSMPQADWHAGAQQRYMDWLAAGGFKQKGYVESVNENSGYDAAVLMSRRGTQCEELKFSLIRISDAVE